jgi:hypothetical protein
MTLKASGLAWGIDRQRFNFMELACELHILKSEPLMKKGFS